MAVEPRFTSDDISFADAIAVTQSLLNDLEQGNADAFEATVRGLVRSENGARGFFVTYLSDDRLLTDHPTPTIIAALQTSPAIVAPLLIKNLAMSTAMAMTHRRNQDAGLGARVRTSTIAHYTTHTSTPVAPGAGRSTELARDDRHKNGRLSSVLGTLGV
jgi:hypothetical protein